MIESHLPLARAVARRYAGRGADLEDLVQIGAVGLIKAVDGFDPGRGVAFSTFATPRIEGEIRHHLRDQAASVRIPRELQRMTGELRRCRAELAATLGRSPTVSELAGALKADERDVERALVADRARESVSISPDGPAADSAAASEPFAGSDERLLLAGSLRTLDERERRIVYLRFHADMTERQIAHEVGISQAHVSRLLAGALAKLRSELARSDDPAARSDITQESAISPPSEGERVVRESQAKASRAKSARGRAATVRVDNVGAPQTVAKQLELPYDVTVTTQGDGDRTWWTATVAGLPDCSARGATAEEAVQRLRPKMEAWLSATLADARGPAAPGGDAAKRKPTSSHSGRFLVRMPSALHAQLSEAAERKNVSLNRLVTDMLAAAVAEGPSAPASPSETIAPDGPETTSSRPPGRSVRIALAANLVIVAFAGLIAAVLLVLALERGI